MKPIHILLMLFTVAVWGFNFVATRVALGMTVLSVLLYSAGSINIGQAKSLNLLLGGAIILLGVWFHKEMVTGQARKRPQSELALLWEHPRA